MHEAVKNFYICIILPVSIANNVNSVMCVLKQNPTSLFPSICLPCCSFQVAKYKQYEVYLANINDFKLEQKFPLELGLSLS